MHNQNSEGMQYILFKKTLMHIHMHMYACMSHTQTATEALALALKIKDIYGHGKRIGNGFVIYGTL